MDAHDISRIIRRLLIIVCAIMLVVGTVAAYLTLRGRSILIAEDHARTLLATAQAIRTYTTQQLAPALAHEGQSVHLTASQPSFAAQSIFRIATNTDHGLVYREVAINPTNPADRPSEFEIGLIRGFQDRADLTEVTGLLEGSAHRHFYLATPIRVTDQQCLTCHGDPADAPPTLIARYGSVNGFWWKLNDVVGIQLVTIPVTAHFSSMLQVSLAIALAMLLMFIVFYILLAGALERSIVAPLRSLARVADAASLTGTAEVQPPPGAARELRVLATAIERLRLSLAKALARIEGADRGAADR